MFGKRKNNHQENLPSVEVLQQELTDEVNRRVIRPVNIPREARDKDDVKKAKAFFKSSSTEVRHGYIASTIVKKLTRNTPNAGVVRVLAN
jgi:hypothetical protein